MSISSPTPVQSSIPPKPPDMVNSNYTTDPLCPPNTRSHNPSSSFKEVLLENSLQKLISFQMPNSFAPMEIRNTKEPTEHEMEKHESDLQVSLSADDLHRIYHPWRYSLIIKLFGKRIQHQYLKEKGARYVENHKIFFTN